MKKNNIKLSSIPTESYAVAVSVRNLVSQEGIIKDGLFSHIISNVSFEVKKGEVLALVGEDFLQTRIVTEIVSSLRNYYNGQCILAERGMMRDKRHILPHLFFFDHNSMLFENMRVLEYCTFILNRRSKNYAQTQKDILLVLIDTGLDYIALTPINMLTEAEKCLVQLFAALLTKSNIVVAELSRISFLASEIIIFSKIVNLMTKQDCSVLLATMQKELVCACAKRYIEINQGVSSLPKRAATLTLTQKYTKLKAELYHLIDEGKTVRKTANTKNTLLQITADIETADQSVAALATDNSDTSAEITEVIK